MPNWAKTVEHDQYGLYADLNIQNITQRFRWIEPGVFMMGSPEDEEDLHQVRLSKGFWLADTTVTQALWKGVMGKNPSRFKGDERPVEAVSWDDCQQFIQKLNTQIPGLQATLPTEAEWEYACRAGTSTSFYFGGKASLSTDKVNYSGKWDEGGPGGETRPVKSYAPNGWGLYEMHGNVWEWCQDVWQENLGTKPVADPQGQAGGEQEEGADQASGRRGRVGKALEGNRKKYFRCVQRKIMKQKFFHIPVMDAADAEAELNSFCNKHRIQHLEKHFVNDGQQSFWSVCVTWSQPSSVTCRMALSLIRPTRTTETKDLKPLPERET